MKESEVVALMRTSKTSLDWRQNCDKVKKAFGGDYPEFWYKAIITSGVMRETMGEGSDQIRVTSGSNLREFLKKVREAE